MKKFHRVHTTKTHMKTDGVAVTVHTSAIGFNGRLFMFMVNKAQRVLGSTKRAALNPWKGWM